MPTKIRGLTVMCAVLGVLAASACVPFVGISGNSAAEDKVATQALTDELAELGIDANVTHAITSDIIAKNSSKLSGSVTAPPSIVAKNSSKYWVASAADRPVSGVWVALQNPAGQLFSINGKLAITKTDDAGHFDFGTNELPSGIDVVVIAAIGRGRQLFAYSLSLPGSWNLTVSPASTTVYRFLEFQARKLGRALSSFDGDQLRAITLATDSMLDKGDFTFGEEGADPAKAAGLATKYQSALRTTSAGVLAQWRDLLGTEPAEALAPGTLQSGEAPTSLSQ